MVVKEKGAPLSRKAVSSLIIILLLTSMLILAFNAQLVKADPGETIIDTEVGESRFTTSPARQSPYYWVHVQDHDTFHTRAYSNNFWYTLCGADGTGEPLYYGTWQVSLPTSGNYEVFAWIPNPDAFVYDGRTYTPTQSAVYQIYYQSGLSTKVVNQRLRTGNWYSLGTFTFASSATIILNDRTGEAYASTMIAFDAIKFVYNNNPPVLSNGYVTPSSGDTSTTFSYYVTYSDPEGDVPTTKYVYIDGSPYTMTKISGDYVSGAVFRYSTSLSAGSHSYYFYFDDGQGHTVRLPTAGTYSGPNVSSPPPTFDFTLGISPSSGSAQQGGSASATVTVTLTSGSTQTVTLSTSGLPSGAYATFNPSSGYPTFTSTFTVSTSTTTPTGTFYITIIGSTPSLTRTTTYTLTVTPLLVPDFSISASPTSLTIQQGSSDSSTITITSINGFNQPVQLSVSGAPSGVTATPSPSQVTPPTGGTATSTLTVSVDITVISASYTLTVTGIGDGLTHSAPISLDVTLASKVFNPPFEFSSSPGAGWDVSTGAAQASHDSIADKSIGSGNVVAKTWSALGGSGMALATLTFEDWWISDWSGETRAKATLNVNGLIIWSAISFMSPLPVGAMGQGLFFNASLRIYDYSTSMEVWRKDLDIYHYQSDYEFAPLGSYGGDSKSFHDSQYVIQGRFNLEAGHRYSWTFEMRLYAWIWLVDMGGGKTGGDLKINLGEVSIDRLQSAPEPVPNVFCERYLDVMIGSPADLLLVDAEGRRVGFDFVTQQEVNEIPEAFYSGHGTSPQLIEIPLPITGDYLVFVSGTNAGFYSLSAILGNLTEENATNLNFSAFTAVEIPVAAGAIDQYTIDWATLSLGGEGVIVQVDSDGDGVFEHTFASDSNLTQSEFLAQMGLPKLSFEIVWGDENFIVSVESNSTVYNFAFSQPDKEISFNVAGLAGTNGICNVTIPRALLYGEPWTVLIDGAPVPATITENATHTSLYFTYTHSTHAIQIIGTWVIGPSPDTNPPLIGTPSQEPEPDKVMPDQAVRVSVSVTDVESGVKNVFLSYTTNGGATWTNLTMVYNATVGLYQATIPAFPSGTNICYKIIAYDNADNVAINDNAGQYYCYTVNPPAPPQLSVSISPLSASILVGQSVTFTSTVSGGYTPYSYQWYLNGNPVSSATSASWTFAPTSSGIYCIYLKVTDTEANTAQSETARITVATIPVGGYSFPIQVTTKAEPITPYIVLIATLTAIFTKLRRKTKRKH